MGYWRRLSREGDSVLDFVILKWGWYDNQDRGGRIRNNGWF